MFAGHFISGEGRRVSIAVRNDFSDSVGFPNANNARPDFTSLAASSQRNSSCNDFPLAGVSSREAF